MDQHVIERVTTGVAAGAIISPAWLPALKDLSETAALLLPILGAVWLFVQIMTRIFRK
jgi:hypothetical protein